MRTVTAAALECDTPMPPIVEQMGTYGDIFEGFLGRGLTAYAKGAGKQQVQLQVVKRNIVDKDPFPDLDAVDCIVLTGSKHNAWDNDPWILRLVGYVREAYDRAVPVVGMCFGHQIIARALGAAVGRNDKGWEISVNSVQLTPIGEALFGTTSLSLYQMHRDIVFEIPEGCQSLGSSAACHVQGLYQPRRVISVQGHPEFNTVIMGTILDARHEQGVFDDEQYVSAKHRNGSHDGGLVGVAVWRFLLGV